MSHVHEPATTREVHEIREDTGTGMGMVVGVLLALALAGIMLWFLFGARVIGNNTNPNTPDITNPTINVDPPNINVQPPNINVNPPAQNPVQPVQP
jgi:flagellar basal body-associated protein FliL